MEQLPKEILLFKAKNGIRHPDYNFWWNWIEKQELQQADSEALWTALFNRWVNNLTTDLGATYSSIVISDFVFLSPLIKQKIEPIFIIANETKQFVLQNFITEFSDEAPKLILLFDDESLYRKYLEPLYLEHDSEWQPSIGVFLSGVTYPHIALTTYDDLLTTQAILSHELTHFYTSPYSLPRWLDEGLASFVQHSIVKSANHNIDSHMLRAHREYWTTDKLEALLSGELFLSLEVDHELIYQISEILVRNLINSDIEKFRLLLSKADASDGGRSAVTMLFGVGLIELLKEIVS